MSPNRFCTTGFLLVTLSVSTASHALLDRAHLASDGNDAHPCTLAKPCRHLPVALAAVADGGEVWMLDSAGFNRATVTIDKSVTILAVPGASAGVHAVAGPAISIAASGLRVVLRNLVVSPLPGAGGTTGVRITGGSRLIVEDSTFSGLPDRGVEVVGSGRARITNTTFRGNQYSVAARDGGTIDVAGSTFSGNFSGVSAYNSIPAATSRVTVSDSVFAYHDFGLSAESLFPDSTATVHATRCSVTNSSEYALFVWAPASGSVATVSIGGSLVANNNYAFFRSGLTGTIYTFGNNQFIDNATSFGSLTPIGLQ